jgi:hypothetical protein
MSFFPFFVLVREVIWYRVLAMLSGMAVFICLVGAGGPIPSPVWLAGVATWILGILGFMVLLWRRRLVESMLHLAEFLAIYLLLALLDMVVMGSPFGTLSL